ncbi:LOW QUALITY PROTEIN: hypothetical protein HID58_055069, partial [Brassica napus]
VSVFLANKTKKKTPKKKQYQKLILRFDVLCGLLTNRRKSNFWWQLHLVQWEDLVYICYTIHANQYGNKEALENDSLGLYLGASVVMVILARKINRLRSQLFQNTYSYGG